jgi:hypothetical protein
MAPDPDDDDAVLIVDLEDPENVAYWRAKWGVSEQQLRDAVEHAGAPEAPAVAFALGKPTP